MSPRNILLYCLLLFFAAACGEMVGDDSPDRLAQGYTPCGDYPDQTYGVVCHPNQYCLSHSMGWCSSGCLSNDNCAEEQTCVKKGSQNVGTCLAPEETTGLSQSGELEPGYTLCGTSSDSRKTVVCHPSQYCDSDYWGTCSMGCLSEYNCTDTQICIKEEGENIGTCQAIVDDEVCHEDDPCS